jgi:mono/diheme cytochrome c family protein
MSMLRTGRVLLASGVLIVGAVVFSACSSGGSPEAVPSDPVLAVGQQIYKANCASCHGQKGGGGIGPKLAGLVAERYPNIADQEAVIANGRGSMPKFGSRLSTEEINAVVRYTRELLGAE